MLPSLKSLVDWFTGHPNLSISIAGFIGTLFGAWLGAYYGYRYMLKSKDRETRARRQVLFQLLRDEQLRIEEGIPKETATPYWIHPIKLTAPALLLDGVTLTYKSWGELIKALLELEWRVSEFNQLAGWANKNFYERTTIHPTEVKKTLDEYWKAIAEVWARVLQLLHQEHT